MYIQWNWPQTQGEDKYVAMLGGLHIEMAIWNTYGDYLETSGWTTALTQAGIASPGTADPFLKAALSSKQPSSSSKQLFPQSSPGRDMPTK